MERCLAAACGWSPDLVELQRQPEAEEDEEEASRNRRDAEEAGPRRVRLIIGTIRDSLGSAGFPTIDKHLRETRKDYRSPHRVV